MSQPKPDPPDLTPQPTPDEVRTELARILGSQCFAQAARSSDFLRYVVERSLAGEAERLKGYTIAIEVFKRPASFDAQSDPAVRVEAGRLRRRLLEYYVAEGYENPLRIDLPRGRYAPEFSYAARTHDARATPAASARAEPPATPPARLGSRWRRLRTLVVLGVIAVLATLVIVERADKRGARQAPAEDRALALPSGPRIVVLPFENLSGDTHLDYFADGFTEEIMLRLGAFNLFVIASQATSNSRGAAQPSNAETSEIDAPYLLTGSVRAASERVRISARLVDRATGGQLWTSAYDEDLTVETLLAIQEKIATEVARAISVPYGPIFDRELARAARKPAEHLDTYDCVLKYYAYRRALDPAAHTDTLACFRSAVTREPRFADAWGGLALLYLDEYAFGYDPQDDLHGPLDRAHEAARTGLDIDGDNYFANLALARVRFFKGDLKGFARSADKVLTLQPNNSEALAMIGTLFAVSGSPARGEPLAAKALALAPHPPPNYYIARALLDLRAGRADDSLSEALRVDAPSWFISPLLVAASAGLAGRTDVAARAVARLLELYPTFPQVGRAELSKWQIDPPLRTQLEQGLRKAGIEID
jgi:TolB-like protein